jgi:hypothetical protein
VKGREPVVEDRDGDVSLGAPLRAIAQVGGGGRIGA